ncbi:MAG TPA: amidase family protein [Gammaproteobacteria bacterium]|nr:amidase family protein [Gammaproteobacteria bacterium]
MVRSKHKSCPPVTTWVVIVASHLLNLAVTHRLAGRARLLARGVQAMRSGAPLGPLHGLPVAIKEAENVAGLPTTKGALIHAELARPRPDLSVF